MFEPVPIPEYTLEEWIKAAPSGLSMREVQKQYLVLTLQRLGNNKYAVARQMGVSPRCVRSWIRTWFKDSAKV